MKKLILYSDQVTGGSDKVDTALLRLLHKTDPQIAYIPSRGDVTRKYYNQRAYYGRLGINDLLYFDIDIEYDPSAIEDLLSCDAIHLSGGDTAYFLYSLKKRGFIDILRQYVQKGGILIGVSAGSILMSDRIDVVTVLEDGEDVSSDTNSLGLCDFEFVPHWERNCVYLNAIRQYSEQRKTTIYACGDSDGILVHDHETTFIGHVIRIRNGRVRHM